MRSHTRRSNTLADSLTTRIKESFIGPTSPMFSCGTLTEYLQQKYENDTDRDSVSSILTTLVRKKFLKVCEHRTKRGGKIYRLRQPDE